MTRECPHCSAPLEDGDAVCPSCGQPVVPTEGDTSVGETQPEAVEASAVAPQSETEEEPNEASPVDEAPDAAPAEAPETPDLASAAEESPAPEVRFDAPDDPQFETEASALDAEPPDGAAPAAPTRFVVFRCDRCQMPMAPGTTACLRCGLPRAQPVPKIPIHASLQTPFLRQGQYHCPECQAVLAPQSNLCTTCGAEFVSAVPPVSWGTPGAGATGGNAALWTRPAPSAGRPEAWKIAAAAIAVVAFAVVLLMIGALSAGRSPTETIVTTGSVGPTPTVIAPPTPNLPPVIMSPGAGGSNGDVHATPVGTWVRERDTLRLDEIGGAWVDAPDITGSKSKVNMNWTLVDTPTGQMVHVQGPGYSWDFAWNFGADGSETLTQAQWGELRKLPDGKKPGAKPVPKPAGTA